MIGDSFWALVGKVKEGDAVADRRRDVQHKRQKHADDAVWSSFQRKMGENSS
jgi:hypothetical protein